MASDSSTARDSPSRNEGSNVATDAAHAKLLRFVRTESYDSRPVRVEILRFRANLAIGSGEEQPLGNECVELHDVGRELRRPEACLECDDFRVGFAAHRGVHDGKVVVHAFR